jgi:hypothetical protein
MGQPGPRNFEGLRSSSLCKGFVFFAYRFSPIDLDFLGYGNGSTCCIWVNYVALKRQKLSSGAITFR